jgi:AcrR family transcriptional regulator
MNMKRGSSGGEQVRRRRDPAATREAILAAARIVLAADGRDALSLTKVAHVAGVNRGTAYQHFKTRDELVKATVAWVSQHLADTLFGAQDDSGIVPDAMQRPVYEVISGLVEFAVENPGLGRIWLFEVLASADPGEDVFFKRFERSTRELAESEYGAEGIDAEALSVMMVGGYFLWPLWVRAGARTKKEREAMALRMRREVLRFCLHGILRAEKFPHLQELLQDLTPRR